MTYGLVRVAVLGEREKSRFKFNCQLNATLGGC